MDLWEKVRSDSKKQVVAEPGFCQEAWSEYRVLARIQKKSPWRTHQSVGAIFHLLRGGDVALTNKFIS